jgi:hypothetical protein
VTCPPALQTLRLSGRPCLRLWPSRRMYRCPMGVCPLPDPAGILRNCEIGATGLVCPEANALECPMP